MRFAALVAPCECGSPYRAREATQPLTYCDVRKPSVGFSGVTISFWGVLLIRRFLQSLPSRSSMMSVVMLCCVLMVETFSTGVVRAAPLIPATGVHKPAAHHPNRLLVRFKSQSVAAVTPIEQWLPHAKKIRTSRHIPHLNLIEVPAQQLDETLATLRSSNEVLYAEYDYIVHADSIPDDPLFDQQWGLYNTGQTVNGDPGQSNADIRAIPTWDFWTGDPEFRVAVIDTGVDYLHPDLRSNIMINLNEIPNNGMDDDFNGWRDDTFGYNTMDNNGDVMDEQGHGTHIAGILGASGNNFTGITGVGWQCKIVALKFLDENGNGFISDAIEAMEYVISNRILLSNNSWGCIDCYSQSLYDIILLSQRIGHLFIASAGNGILGLGINTDQIPYYPASYDLSNIISVAASNNNDLKPKFSNFGILTVDLAAPGDNIFSTAPGGGYEFRRGTSMATAFVTGTSLLLMSRRPDLTWSEVKNQILMTVRPAPAFEDLIATSGILNVQAAVGDCNDNSVLDEDDIASEVSLDCNMNGIPDECEPDCNFNQVSDLCDIADGTSLDCNENFIPDECEPDCDMNNQADGCDIADEIHTDCNHNQIPDLCEPRSNVDCNRNLSPDLCDLSDGTSLDCNENGVPDECDIMNLISEDCTGNGLPDECERDCNGNGIADSCDIFSGNSNDDDFDQVPDECVLGISLTPVDASLPHIIEKNQIDLVQGAARITLEVRITGWDPDQDANPLLRSYQIALKPEGFTSADTGNLTLANLECENNDDCLGDSVCESSGYCDPWGSFNIDESREDFVFFNYPTITIADPFSVRMGALLFNPQDALKDDGDTKYVGTILLDVSPDAAGTFTLEFSVIDTILTDSTGDVDSIPITGYLPATIVIAPDCNGNRVPDALDISKGTSIDCDHNNIPDDCVPVNRDCNSNRIPDSCEIEINPSLDCNRNGILDSCIFLESDCNDNNIPDLCDTVNETSADCNNNGIPDECMELETDCNQNGIPDACDIDRGTSRDCNKNSKPDTCDDDCNGNGIADECDIADRTSRDRDDNNIPDECQNLLMVPESFPTIQSAIDQAIDGDTILIADGVYTGAGNVNIDIRGKSIVILGEGGPENCILDAAGEQAGFFVQRGETNHTRIEGLTIKNAVNAGIICFRSSPTIRNCIITHNGPIAGGILAIINSDPVIENCLITDNRSGFSGGGIRCTDRSHPTIRHCIIANNRADEFGGGVFVVSGDSILTHTTIIHNQSIDGGGGIALHNGNAVMQNCTITGNETGLSTNGNVGDGGGMHLINMTGSFSGNVITGNHAQRDGGGVFIARGDPTITNCTIAHNRSNLNGGGLYWFDSLGEQIACCTSDSCIDIITPEDCLDRAGTIYPGLDCTDVTCGTLACCLPDEACEDTSFFSCLSAGGVPQVAGTQCANYSCQPSTSNSILWGNISPENAQIFTDNLLLHIANSTIQDGWMGEENNVIDPDFVSPGYWTEQIEWVDGDYHLTGGSESINGGRNDRITPEFVDDRDGRPRILCGQIDRGAYEFGIGDYNCDQGVDLFDFQQWPDCMTGAEITIYPSGCQAFDFNADFDVDLRDYAEFQNHIGVE